MLLRLLLKTREVEAERLMGEAARKWNLRVRSEDAIGLDDQRRLAEHVRSVLRGVDVRVPPSQVVDQVFGQYQQWRSGARRAERERRRRDEAARLERQAARRREEQQRLAGVRGREREAWLRRQESRLEQILDRYSDRLELCESVSVGCGQDRAIAALRRRLEGIPTGTDVRELIDQVAREYLDEVDAE